MDSFNIKRFLKDFLPFAVIGFVIDLVLSIRLFSYIGVMIGAFLGTEYKSKKK